MMVYCPQKGCAFEVGATLPEHCPVCNNPLPVGTGAGAAPIEGAAAAGPAVGTAADGTAAAAVAAQPAEHVGIIEHAKELFEQGVHALEEAIHDL